MILLIAIVGMLGCGDPAIPPEEIIATKTAYDSVLASLPDSIQRRLPPLDSLFLLHRGQFEAMPQVDSTEARRWVESTLAGMTLEEKIGQLFIAHLSEREYAGLSNEATNAVREFHVGGFLVPRLLSPRKVFEETQRLQQAVKVPLFFAADYERGVGRFNNALTELPSNMAIGATRDTLFAAAAGRLTAIEARAIGVNLLFAPVVDVNNNPANPIINIRSYGEEPELVGQMAASFVREAQAYGLLTTLKHFPGHGDTEVDTHSRMGVIEGSRADLERVELMPYRVVFGGKTQPAAVMSAHLWIKAVESRPLPGTFSSNVLTTLLRRELGFQGLVITDDIRMGALQFQYDMSERILRPLRAGANVILTPANLGAAIGAVRTAVRNGSLSTTIVDESARRVLFAKATAGLHRQKMAKEKRLEVLLEEPLGSYIAQAIADRSITLLKTSSELPLRSSQHVSVVHLANFRAAESIEAAMNLFDELIEPDRSSRLDEEPSERQITSIVERCADADVIVLTLYLRLVAGRGNAGLFPRQARLVNELMKMGKPVVLLTFGNPYAASTFRGADAVLVAYDQSLQTAYAAARVLRAEQPAPGRLPITVDPFAYGSGMDWVDGR